MRARTLWFVLLILVIVSGGWGVRYVLRSFSPASAPVVRRSPQEIRTAWVAGVQSILASYDQTSNASQARDALLKLFVNAEDQPVHLALVLAFQAGIDRHPNAVQKLQSARRDFLQKVGQP